ncbi:MAG: MdtA/MuxA family multidrug efflux RND transporter periplasmic adaptor subunit [Candidatus Acidiferrales bacterium]
MGSRQTIEPHPAENRKTPLSQELALSPHKKHRWWVWVLIVVILGVAVWYFRGVAQKQSQTASASARAKLGNVAIPVVVAVAQKGDLPVYYTGLGTVTAFYTVTVHTRVDGQIMTVYFKEGQFVHKGDALVELDPRPYQVQLEQAEGQLAKDEATLKDATLDFNRYTTLAAEGVIPRQQLDTQTSVMNQAQGAIKSDQATIDSAKLELIYCHVTAPISGRIGLRLVDPGNIVHATDTTGLIVITQLQPIAVIFTLPQDQLPEVYKELRAHDRLPVDAYDRDDTSKITSGYLQTMDNQIDTTTGTYKLKAVFSNQDNALFPNQFVNIHLLVDTEHNVTIIPAAAVQRGPNGTYVYVVNSSNAANVRAVKVGLATGNSIAIDSGLKPGEEVVTDGLDKLTDGSKIEPRNPTGGAAGVQSGQQPPPQAGTTPKKPGSPASPKGGHSGGPQK